MFKIIAIVWLHFIADFILQTDKMAINKSKMVSFLALHSLVYTLPFIILGWKYAVINGILHFMVDGITSKITSYFLSKDKKHWFFVTIGADQAIHLTCLILTGVWL